MDIRDEKLMKLNERMEVSLPQYPQVGIKRVRNGSWDQGQAPEKGRFSEEMEEELDNEESGLEEGVIDIREG